MADGLGTSVLGVYCERGLDSSFWAEPANAISNAGFIVAGLVMLKRPPDRGVTLLALVTLAIGVGSFLFHTLATRGAMIADVAPIQAFIAIYFCFAMRRFVGLGWIAAVCATIAFMAAAAAVPSIMPDRQPWRGLGGYAGGLLGLVGLGVALAAIGGSRASVGRSLLAVACLFATSLAFRTVDTAACAIVSTGTHAVWHMLNAIVLYALMRIMARRPAFDPISR